MKKVILCTLLAFNANQAFASKPIGDSPAMKACIAKYTKLVTEISKTTGMGTTKLGRISVDQTRPEGGDLFIEKYILANDFSYPEFQDAESVITGAGASAEVQLDKSGCTILKFEIETGFEFSG